MTDVERSINKKIITDAESFLKDRKNLTSHDVTCLSPRGSGR